MVQVQTAQEFLTNKNETQALCLCPQVRLLGFLSDSSLLAAIVMAMRVYGVALVNTVVDHDHHVQWHTRPSLPPSAPFFLAHWRLPCSISVAVRHIFLPLSPALLKWSNAVRGIQDSPICFLLPGIDRFSNPGRPPACSWAVDGRNPRSVSRRVEVAQSGCKCAPRENGMQK